MDDFSSDRSGKQNAAICQTAGDTGMRCSRLFACSFLNAGFCGRAPVAMLHAHVLGTA